MSLARQKLKVVYDCMIYLQATISETGLAAKLFRLIENDEVSLFVSEDILNEIRDVLSRPKIREKNPHMTDEYVEAFLEKVLSKAHNLTKVPSRFTCQRDPKDEKYINLAVEAEAAYIVSRDKDLLDLMTGFADDCKEFRQKFRHLKIVEPLEFLQIVIEKESSLKL